MDRESHRSPNRLGRLPLVSTPLSALLNVFRPQFIETASHYDDLGEFRRQYAAVLTYAALACTDKDEATEFRSALNALPEEGLQEAARTLSQALESAGAQREDYWANRIEPFWQNIWPKSLDLVSVGITKSLVLMSIAAGEKFPDAVKLIHGWLRPLEYPHYVVHRLRESDFCARFPNETLCLLHAVISDQPGPLPELEKCLTNISEAMPEIQNDPRYQRLKEYTA